LDPRKWEKVTRKYSKEIPGLFSESAKMRTGGEREKDEKIKTMANGVAEIPEAGRAIKNTVTCTN